MSETSVADGTLPHGSFDITILETGQAYVADNFSGDQKVKEIVTNSAIGNPRRRKLLKGPWDGTCDLQLEEKDTPKPEFGQTFVADEDADGTAEPFMVKESGRTYTADDVFKCKASISKMLNSLIYASSGKTTAQVAAGLADGTGSPITSVVFQAYVPKGLTADASPFSATGLPTGLAINASSGAVTGTPSATGTFYVTIKHSATRTIEHNGAARTETFTGTRKFKWVISAP